MDLATAGHRERARRGQPHPVEDFLFTYYPWKPSRLRRWHPGVGTGLEDPDGTAPQASWRWYVREGGIVQVDAAGLAAARQPTLRFVAGLLRETLSRPGRFGCFGLHEWAMVYRLDQADTRHASWPLRLGRAETDSVVEGHAVACSHFDAFRFFTPQARPRNALEPTRETQTAMEQPGCLHAGMDLYKWAMKLEPAVPSDLVMDCFELALDIRTLDMQASPYDLRALGYQPVRIETAEGKAEYARRQREFTVRSNALRRRLLDVVEALGTE